jgi:hypothetical protein
VHDPFLGRQREFEFDAVIGPGDSQQQVTHTATDFVVSAHVSRVANPAAARLNQQQLLVSGSCHGDRSRIPWQEPDASLTCYLRPLFDLVLEKQSCRCSAPIGVADNRIKETSPWLATH